MTWWNGSGWSLFVDDAVDVGDEAEEILARETAARRVNVPYAIEASIDAAGHVRPAHIKDRVRALGPTVRRDLAVPTRRQDRLGLGDLMYQYDHYDQAMVDARVAEFRDQARRRLEGKLTEDQFKPLRLMNGLYLQLHAYMLRVAIPYGTLNARQMAMLADIAEKYDRGYGHFTTRQNIQYNWIKLEDAADILADLATVEMHAIQTERQLHPQHQRRSLRRARRQTRWSTRAPYAELLRQWSSFHPRIHLPAAQIQDRGNRQRERPRGDATTRYRHPDCQPRWRDRRTILRRRRHGPHADDCAADPRFRAARSVDHLCRGRLASLQPLRPARQQVQGADQDPRP